MAPGPTDPAILDSPFAAELGELISQFYGAMDAPFVSPDMFVCTCPVCMTQEVREAIVATPARDMPAELIQEYSNSAHEPNHEGDTLRALLPRYLDLMARDIAVDTVGVATELYKFGKMVQLDPDFMTVAQTDIYHNIAACMIAHFGWREGKGHDDITTPFSLMDMFLTGGVASGRVLTAMDELFDHADVGCAALLQMCRIVTSRPEEKEGWFGADMFGIGYAHPSVRVDVAAWFSSDAMLARLYAAYLDDNVPDVDLAVLDRALDIFPKMNAIAFVDHDAKRRATQLK